MMKKVILLFMILIVGLFSIGCQLSNEPANPAGQATNFLGTDAACDRFEKSCGFEDHNELVAPDCKPFMASEYSFNPNSITGDQVCEQNDWGLCHSVIATNTIEYSYDKNNAFFNSASIVEYLTCNFDLKSSSSGWKEVTELWNPFDQPLYFNENNRLAGGSVLCCK